MKCDRESLIAERSVAELDLKGRQAKYEIGFKDVSAQSAIPPLSFSLSSADGITHREVGGSGKSAQEALADWQTRLDSHHPKAGALLHWRVTPEVDWTYDFEKQEPFWRVYARFATA